MLKMIADLSFYFTFANFIAVVFELPAVILFLPPVVYLVYSIVTILRSKHYKKQGQPVYQFAYEGVFTLYLKLFIPFALIMILFARSTFETASLPFAIIFLTTAIILLRMMRQPPQVRKEWRFRLLNLFPIVCVFLAGITITSRQFFDLSGTILSAIYFNVIIPILLALGMAIAFVLSPIFWLLSPALQEGSPPQVGYGGEPDQWIEVETVSWSPMLADVLRAFMAVVVILLAVYLLVKLFRRITEQQLGTVNMGGVIQRYIAVENKKAAKNKSRGSTGQLQRYYRRFLRLCWKNGITREIYMTSADYEALSTRRFQLGDTAARFREFYIAVRYGKKEATSEDIASSKKLYNRISELVRESAKKTES